MVVRSKVLGSSPPVVVYPKGPPAPPTVRFTIVIEPCFVFVYVQVTFAPAASTMFAVCPEGVPPAVQLRFVNSHPAGSVASVTE